MVKVHIIGWSSKKDKHCDLSKAFNRFATPKSISRRKAHRLTHLQKGDYLDVCPTIHHHSDEWFAARIVRLEARSGQVQVIYIDADGNDCLYWVHLDDVMEVDEFAKRSRPAADTLDRIKEAECRRGTSVECTSPDSEASYSYADAFDKDASAGLRIEPHPIKAKKEKVIKELTDGLFFYPN